jgi:small redox-active disulfide protein 2
VRIEVLGSGCSKCEVTERLVRETAARLGLAVEVEKVQDMQRIAAMGVLATPAVAIDGKVVHAGRVPRPAEIESWLAVAS